MQWQHGANDSPWFQPEPVVIRSACRKLYDLPECAARSGINVARDSWVKAGLPESSGCPHFTGRRRLWWVGSLTYGRVLSPFCCVPRPITLKNRNEPITENTFITKLKNTHTTTKGSHKPHNPHYKNSQPVKREKQTHLIWQEKEHGKDRLTAKMWVNPEPLHTQVHHNQPHQTNPASPTKQLHPPTPTETHCKQLLKLNLAKMVDFREWKVVSKAFKINIKLTFLGTNLTNEQI